MSSITEAWNKEKEDYCNRYYQHYKRYEKCPDDIRNHGQLIEASYVLISVFGLSDKDIQMLEKFGCLID